MVLALVASMACGGLGYAVARSQSSPTLPGPTSAEAGFARDMQVHHVQGVEMSMAVRDRTDDPDIRRMAFDMATTQGHQAGQLYGWLTAWGLQQLGREPPMAWMGHTGHTVGSLMPGMATPAQMAELSAVSGVDAERLFLTLMIAHHRSALDMAEAVQTRSTHQAVLAFARGVIASQQAEIDLMTTLLAARGGAPASR